MGAGASVPSDELEKPLDASDVATPRGESALAEVRRLRQLLAAQAQVQGAAASSVDNESLEVLAAKKTNMAFVFIKPHAAMSSVQVRNRQDTFLEFPDGPPPQH